MPQINTTFIAVFHCQHVSQAVKSFSTFQWETRILNETDLCVTGLSLTFKCKVDICCLDLHTHYKLVTLQVNVSTTGKLTCSIARAQIKHTLNQHVLWVATQNDSQSALLSVVFRLPRKPRQQSQKIVSFIPINLLRKDM